jgi:hypothetical protein
MSKLSLPPGLSIQEYYLYVIRSQIPGLLLLTVSRWVVCPDAAGALQIP